ncbi:MAG: hypothetical protein LUG13_08490 [Oscillospiraceae bacterium]|nr:hypothetical protein [Oscillospiraceae bacterium]
MATSKKTEEQPDQDTAPVQPEMVDITELCKRHGIRAAVFAGVCTVQDWKSGKAVSEKEFLAAVKQFTGTPMKARKKANGT